MHKFILGIAALGLAASMAVLSATQAPGNFKAGEAQPLAIAVEGKNPWTSIALNNPAAQFSVRDRHRSHGRTSAGSLR